MDQVTEAAVEIEGGLERLDIEFIYELLRHTHWACNRPQDVFERAIKNSFFLAPTPGSAKSDLHV